MTSDPRYVTIWSHVKNDDLNLVWRALADDTRRRLLDALRDKPLTTGELCRPFKVSRYAVMKHLAILEQAGLIVVRRQGRERWNHLNAVPIQQIYERWVRPYAGVWAGTLVNLKGHVEETKGGNPMSDNPKTRSEFGVVQIELEIPIQAKPARVWQALVEETSQWWHKDFYTGDAQGFVIEPRLGGRVFEDWGDGAGQTWYTVIGLNPPKFLMLQGLLSPAFGGPATTLLQLDLQGTGKTTVLRLSDTLFGCVGDDKLGQTREGWKTLFDDGLRAHVESR